MNLSSRFRSNECRVICCGWRWQAGCWCYSSRMASWNTSWSWCDEGTQLDTAINADMTHVFPSPGLKATLSPSDGERVAFRPGEGSSEIFHRTRYEDAPAMRQPQNWERKTPNRRNAK